MHITQKTETLFERLQNGSEEALSEIYDNYSAPLYGLILKIVKDEMEAQDILQDCFITIWKKASSYDPSKGSFFTWMLNICRNRSIDVIRKSKRTSSHHEEMIATDVISTSIEGINVDSIGIADLLKNLSPEERLIIDYLYFKGYTQQEVSDELGIPLGTIKTRVRRAMQELRGSFHTILILWILKNI